MNISEFNALNRPDSFQNTKLPWQNELNVLVGGKEPNSKKDNVSSSETFYIHTLRVAVFIIIGFIVFSQPIVLKVLTMIYSSITNKPSDITSPDNERPTIFAQLILGTIFSAIVVLIS
jgi:hypothetical protein